MQSLKSIAVVTATTAVGSIWAAIDRDALVAWGGAILALVGASTSGMIAIYHRMREAARSENALDHAQALEEIRALARVQIELEMRIASAEDQCTELSTRIERVACRYPLANGTARCADKESAVHESDNR